MFMESVSVDRENELAYVTFLSEAVARTEAVSSGINVDFSEGGEVVGIEFLNFTQLAFEGVDSLSAAVGEAVAAAQHMVRTRLQGL